MTVQVVCFVGASTVEGVGDEDRLGWPGRLMALAPASEHIVSAYNLGIRGQTSLQMQARAGAECRTRLGDGIEGAIVICFGSNDTAEVIGGPLRVPAGKSERTMRAILQDLKTLAPVLLVGPTPVAEDMSPFRSTLTGHEFNFTNARLETLNESLGAMAAELQVPMLDLFAPLTDDSRWTAALRARDGLHPDGSGYQLMAEKVAAWDAWQRLFVA
ncbi:MAG: GDSL-type esterase/lipase family protein [Rhodospirillales bacterium]|nr:GDSL-type esterase/lipase family protein [Rhodospirillales bacterium]